jgi:hypothetical protein
MLPATKFLRIPQPFSQCACTSLLLLDRLAIDSIGHYELGLVPEDQALQCSPSCNGGPTVILVPPPLSENDIFSVPYRHRGGRMKKINAWYLNTHMVYL